MYAKVLFDAKARRGLSSGWGFSCLLDGKILFDTGDSADTLLENMKRLMVSINDIEGVVISHDHWDHTGGLWEILKQKKGIKVYALESFSDEFKKAVLDAGGKLVIVKRSRKITDNIFLTGEISSEYKNEPMGEQALVVKGEKGSSVLTGCAHPGILKVLDIVKDKMKIKRMYMVFGGFHLDGLKREEVEDVISGLKKMGIKKVGPSHCTGEKARRIFKGKYHTNFIPVKAGHIIQL